MNVQFVEELARVLPADVPNRDRLIQIAAIHLTRIETANEYMNLTRITSPEDAAIKHIYDSVAPWRLFEGAKKVLDAGTGAGFPGLPLSIVLPQTRFTLVESVGKKARFVESVLDELELPNVEVRPERAEAVAVTLRPDIITARAMAPLSKLVDLFRAALKNGTSLLLFKGPDVEAEMREISGLRLSTNLVARYDLPGDRGTRTLVEIKA